MRTVFPTASASACPKSFFTEAPPSTTTIEDSSFSSAVKTRPFWAFRPLASKNFSSQAMIVISSDEEVGLDTLDQALAQQVMKS